MSKKDHASKESPKELPSVEDALPADAPVTAEMQQRMERMKTMLDRFKDKLLAKFEGYVMGLALAPPEKEGERKDKINVLILVDDQDSTKMSKDELHEKLTKSMEAVAKDVDDQIAIDVILVTELWQSLYDNKMELLQILAVSAPIYDAGMLAALKIAEVHKGMVLKKFEKYIACYVLAGSVVRGKATPNSDIDVFVVIDDTDVKKMTRGELKDKLRGIILDMGYQAGQMTGIQNKLNIQVYILTDFWDNIKEANPIIFTFLRDGVPLYDRGVFMPWKQLLKMGKVRPSTEAIELYKSTGDQMLDRIRFKLKDIAVEDMWYAILTPSQAAIMLYGLPPPPPKETPDVMRELFVKQKLFDEKHVKFFEHVVKTHKDVEYGIKKTVTGAEIQEMLEKGEEYLKALGKLYSQIEERKELENVIHLYESTITVVRDVLKLEGIERSSDAESIKLFESEVVHKGVIPERYLRIYKDIHKAKKDYDAGKLSRAEVGELQKNASEFFKFMVEHIQRKRGRDLERVRIKVKHGERMGEVILFEDHAYIIEDVGAESKAVQKADVKAGRIKNLRKSSYEELDHSMANAKVPAKLLLEEKLFDDLKGIFGAGMEILLNW